MYLFRNDSAALHRDGGPAVELKGLKQWWQSGKLHRSDGPAVITSSGTKQYFWRGFHLTEADFLKAIRREIPIRAILKETNAEKRRVLTEMYGWEHLVRDAEAKILDKDAERESILFRVDVSGDESIVIVQVKDSTPMPDGSHKKYFLRVPPGTRTCREAIAWTFNMDAGTYAPEKEA